MEYPSFSRAEYQRRYAAVRREMEQAGVDGLILTGQPNVTYLNGFVTSRWTILLLPREADLVAFVDEVNYRPKDAPLAGAYWGGEANQLFEANKIVADIECAPVPELGRAIGRKLRQLGLGQARIGTAPSGLPSGFDAALCNGLSAEAPDVRLAPASAVVARAKARKSEVEIAAIRRACAVVDAGAKALQAAARPGAREADLWAAYMQAIYAAGGVHFGFLVGVTSTAQPGDWGKHDVPADRVLEAGDLLISELMPSGRDGYGAFADLTLALGEPRQPAAYERVAAACAAAYSRLLARTRPGAMPVELQQAADEPILAAGLVRNAPLLYGIGISLDPPFVGLPAWWSGGDMPLEAGMTVHALVHVYDPVSLACVRIGDTLLVRESGAESLTGFSFTQPAIRVLD